MSKAAVFAGLVFDESDRPLEVVLVGADVSYVVDDAGFRRHIPAEDIDRVVLHQLRQMIMENQQAVTVGAMKMMGAEDLFTKAMIDSSLKNLDEHFNKLMDIGMPENARQWLGMLGFKIIVNYRGEIVNMNWPGAVDDRGDE